MAGGPADLSELLRLAARDRKAEASDAFHFKMQVIDRPCPLGAEGARRVDLAQELTDLLEGRCGHGKLW